MCNRPTRSVVVFVAVLAAAQLVRPSLANPATDASRTIEAQAAASGGLAAVLDRSCADCHSHKTAWPWYARVAPLSWLMAHGVKEGRRAVNFSEWAGYSRNQQRILLAESCQAASGGKMPGKPWTMLHPEARLSPRDVETICGAARQAEANAASGR